MRSRDLKHRLNRRNDRQETTLGSALEAVRGPHVSSSLATLDQQLYEVACDIAYLSETVREELLLPRPDEDRLQKPLHAFCAVLTFRLNKLIQESEAAPDCSRITETLGSLRSIAGAIRFLPPRDIASSFPSTVAQLWQELGKLALCSSDLHLREYDGVLHSADPKLVTSLASLCSKLVIDPDLKEPQIGFGRKIPAEELRDLLGRIGARLSVLSCNDSTEGFYLILTNRRALPPEAEASLLAYEEKFGKLPEKVAWLDVVGISPHGRLSFGRQGIAAYFLMTSAMAQSTFALGLNCLMSEVRVGENMNLARKSHLAVGWEATGVVREHDNNLYEVLRFNPASSAFLAHRSLVEEAPEWKGVLKWSRFPSFQTIHEQMNYRPPDSIEPGQICAANGDLSDLEAYLAQNLR